MRDCSEAVVSGRVTRCAVMRVRGVWRLGFGGIFWVRLC